jgi:hypothetical protein
VVGPGLMISFDIGGDSRPPRRRSLGAARGSREIDVSIIPTSVGMAAGAAVVPSAWPGPKAASRGLR